MPKSLTSAWPVMVKRMFSGLRSRWMTPCAWAYSSADAISPANPTTWLTGNPPGAAVSRSRSDPVATYGIA